MRFLKFLALVAFLSAGAAMATQKKLPLTLKQYGKQYYSEWSGTNYVILSADTVTFYSDTANSYAASPFNLLYSKKINIDREDVYPGEKFPEKVCASFLANGGGDSATLGSKVFYAASKSGTLVQAGAEETNEYASSTDVIAYESFAFDPNLYFAPKLRVTTATDTVFLDRARFWPCDD